MNKMLAFGIITALILLNCSTEEDRLKKTVEEYQALNLNDFSSYELVSLTLDSAMTQADNLKERIDQNRSSLKFLEDGLERAKGMPSLLREGGFLSLK